MGLNMVSYGSRPDMCLPKEEGQEGGCRRSSLTDFHVLDKRCIFLGETYIGIVGGHFYVFWIKFASMLLCAFACIFIIEICL